MKLNVSFTESNSSFDGKMSSNNAEFGCNHEDFLPISGPPGKSAYEVAKENGFVGTEKEWLASLKGEPGEKGEPGAPGTGGSALDIDAVVEAVEEKLNADSFCVTFTGAPYPGYTADKTFSEIEAAHRKGKRIYGVIAGGNCDIVLDNFFAQYELPCFAFNGQYEIADPYRGHIVEVISMIVEYDSTIKGYNSTMLFPADVPKELPNPYALTINGQTYDGSEAVDVTVSGSGDGTPGKDGADGVGIASIKQTTTSTADGGSNVFTVTLTDGNTAKFTVRNGSKGSKGDPGDDYVLTEADKTEIANIVIATIPNANGVSF